MAVACSRVLGIDVSSSAGVLLRFCNYVKRERGFAGTLRAEDLNDPSPWEPANAYRAVNSNA